LAFTVTLYFNHIFIIFIVIIENKCRDFHVPKAAQPFSSSCSSCDDNDSCALRVAPDGQFIEWEAVTRLKLAISNQWGMTFPIL
jgi:hypothetical protein